MTFATQAPTEMFRMHRTKSALQSVHDEITRFAEYANRDWHSAVEYGLCEIAERLSFQLGNVQAGRQFGERKQRALESARARTPRRPRQWRKPGAQPVAPDMEPADTHK